MPGDVTDDRHQRALVFEAQQIGELNLLVDDASALGPSPLPRLRALSSEILIELQRVNVQAPLALIQLALPLLESCDRAVVNVTSDAAVEAHPGWGAYGASKAALEQVSRVLALEEPALHLWWLDPGDMRTEMHQPAVAGEDISCRPLPEAVVPAVLELFATHPASGRIRAADLLAERSS